MKRTILFVHVCTLMYHFSVVDIVHLINFFLSVSLCVCVFCVFFGGLGLVQCVNVMVVLFFLAIYNCMCNMCFRVSTKELTGG
jgi:hypothetical protein